MKKAEEKKGVEEKPLFENDARSAQVQREAERTNDQHFESDALFDEDLWGAEGTRIFIDGNTVTFENMTPALLEVAQALAPGDEGLRAREQKKGRRRRGSKLSGQGKQKA